MGQHWAVARIRVPEERAGEELEEWVAGMQMLLGAQGAYEQASDGGAREWRLFFDPDEVPEGLSETVARAALAAGLDGVEFAGVEQVERENWHDKWREYFQPVRISPGIEVRPSWWKGTEAGAGAGEGSKGAPGGGDAQVVIFVEPGMAFGTGTHATTQLCLRLVEKLVRPGMTVMDAGTGSAILAVAAAKFGARRVLAFDVDPDAEENARFNLELNDVAADQVEIQIGELDAVAGDERFDLVLCNMLSREFLPLLRGLAQRVAQGGTLVLSGLLTTERDEVREAVEGVGFSVGEAAEADEWTALVCRCRD